MKNSMMGILMNLYFLIIIAILVGLIVFYLYKNMQYLKNILQVK